MSKLERKISVFDVDTPSNAHQPYYPQGEDILKLRPEAIISTNNWENGVTVIIPTYKRPEGLARALSSILSQGSCGRLLEVLIADNDPEGSAQVYVKQIADEASVPIIYIHAPQPGVSNARNAAMAKARGRYIAWLDDDQEAGPNWITSYLSTAERYGAALTFCPSPAVIEGAAKGHPFFVKFFSRSGSADSGVISEFHGCGNSFMDRNKFNLPNPVFEPKANESGGEDDILFTYIQSQNVITAWTPESYVMEYVPAWRATANYVRKRSFGFGQGPSRICAGSLNILGLIKWTVIGILQILIYGPLALLLTAIGHDRALHYQCRACEGAGKVFWQTVFQQKLYGAQALALKAKLQRKTKSAERLAHTYSNNRCGFTIDLISSTFPFGSAMKKVSCSYLSPLNRR